MFAQQSQYYPHASKHMPNNHQHSHGHWHYKNAAVQTEKAKTTHKNASLLPTMDKSDDTLGEAHARSVNSANTMASVGKILFGRRSKSGNVERMNEIGCFTCCNLFKRRHKKPFAERYGIPDNGDVN